MKKLDVQIGSACIAKVSGTPATVRLTGTSPYGGDRTPDPHPVGGPPAPPRKTSNREETTTMRLFAIDADNTITAYTAAGQIPESQEPFASEKELAKLAASWPADRLLQIWTSFAGVAGFGADLKSAEKFTGRKSAVIRIWKAIQKLEAPTATATAATTDTATPAPKAAKGATKTATATTGATAGDGTPTAREGSKKAAVLELLRRKGGATLAEIAKATDWQNHSIRGFISGTLIKKMGLKVESTKSETGDRTYRIA
jgi:hypothetical protein